MVERDRRVSRHRTIRVGFILSSGAWLGGRNYLRNLFSAIRTLPGHPITPIIFTGEPVESIASDFPDVEVVRTGVLRRKSGAWLAQKLIARLTGHDIVLGGLMRRRGVSVLSHCLHLDGRVGVTTLGWIPDFQHAHLPTFFSEQERRLRDRTFTRLCALSDKVIVSSECAREDLRFFFPACAGKAELLRFVASPAPFAAAAALSDLQQRYYFDVRYFLLPNQFWAHKNHRVVVEALQVLKARGKPLLVLATGSTADLRNPRFFPELMQYASQCDVLDCFRVLGIVPFDHLLGLMRHSIALINPSRFEGWSTSVEEAKSMGKQILLSDLPVHREQAPPRGVFFPADDAAALADAMTSAYNEFDPHRDAVSQDEALARFPEAQKQFGITYWKIVRGALVLPMEDASL